MIGPLTSHVERSLTDVLSYGLAICLLLRRWGAQWARQGKELQGIACFHSLRLLFMQRGSTCCPAGCAVLCCAVLAVVLPASQQVPEQPGC